METVVTGTAPGHTHLLSLIFFLFWPGLCVKWVHFFSFARNKCAVEVLLYLLNLMLLELYNNNAEWKVKRLCFQSKLAHMY